MRIACAEAGETDAVEPDLRPLARERARDAGGLQPDRHVFERGFPGQQRVRLKQVAGLPVEPGQGGAEDVDAA